MTEHEQVCKTYYWKCRKRISGLIEGLNKHFYAEGLQDIWTAFDGYLSWKHAAESPKGMRDNFARKYQANFEKWQMSDRFNESITILKNLSPVKDMKPTNPNPPKHLTDIKNLSQILDYCYRIRSNLFHGGKDLESNSPEGQRNRNLVEHAFKVSYEILERVLTTEKGIV